MSTRHPSSDVRRQTVHLGRSAAASRQGVVLLVILGMLAILALIGVAFTTFSAQEEASSRAHADDYKNAHVDLDPMVVVLEAIGQLVADTNNPHSAVRGHSLLRDLYGNNNDRGFGPDGQPGVANTDDDQDGVTDNILELGWPGSDDRPNGVIDLYDYYAGAFDGVGETGPDSIVGPLLGPDSFPGIAGVDDDANGIIDDYREVCWPGSDDVAPSDDADVNFVYNSRPPEHAQFPSASGGPAQWLRGAGSDEDYDYPDHNNSFLTAIRADGTCLVPAFYRPGYLNPKAWLISSSNVTDINDWADTYIDGMGNTRPFPSGAAYPAARGRRLILRPRLKEHPSFGAGNLSLPGVYDVDNNSDGISDSVWIDIGFPVQTTLDGRKYKPLVAFMVVDMDGKFNLNAHGNLNFVANHSDFPGGSNMHCGIGATPTEINLENLIGPRMFPSAAAANEYRQLFEGRVTSSGIVIPGKYGDRATIGTGPVGSPPQPKPGGPGLDDDLGVVGMPGSFRNYPGVNNDDNTPFTLGGLHATPNDPDGDGIRLLFQAGGDWAARVVYYRSAGATTGHGNQGDPAAPAPRGWYDFRLRGPDGVFGTSDDIEYVQGEQVNTTGQEGIDDWAELNLYSSKSTDRPFTAEDVESAYRFEDVDASRLIAWLPGSISMNRLVFLAESLFNTNPNVASINRRRRNMTGIGNWDLRNYNIPPVFARDSSAPLAGYTNPWSAGKYNGAFPGLVRNPPIRTQRYGVSKSQANAIEGPAIPDAIRRGKRLNIAPQLRTYTEKYRLFRELYITMMQLCGSQVPADRIAQYCANLVEFQDTETASSDVNVEEKIHHYEFDTKPFDASSPSAVDGFGVDGIHVPSGSDTTGWDNDFHGPDVMIGGDSDVVWGAERPRIVISETLAYQGADGFVRLFIELYNMSDKEVELNGPNQTYELIWGDGNGLPTSEGEPANSHLGNRLKFDNPGGPAKTLILPGEYLLIGPEPVDPKLSGGTAKPVDYQPATPFAPPGPGLHRLFVRRLADPTRVEDAANRDKFPRSDNPYITLDALDFLVYSDTVFTDPSITVYGQVVSKERVSLSVDNQDHAAAIIDPMTSMPTPSHSLGAINSSVTGPMPPIPWLDRPFASVAEMMLVPGVGMQHITTAYEAPVQPDVFSGRDPSASTQDDPSDLQTGAPRTSPFKNSDSDYLYSYLLNFFREDASGAGPPPTAGPGGGLSLPKKPRARRLPANVGPPLGDPFNDMPTPGFYRIFDFVEVPSRMAGSRDWNNREIPTATGSYGVMDRVVGKININTVWEQEILQAACNNHPLSLDATGSIPYTGTILPLNFGVPPVAGTGNLPLAIKDSPLPGQTMRVPFQLGSTAPQRETGNVTSELFRRILVSVANPSTAMTVGSAAPLVVPTGDGTLFTPDDRPFRGLSLGYPNTGGTAPRRVPETIHDTLYRGVPLITGGSKPIFADDRQANPPPGLSGPAAPTDLGGYPDFQMQLYQKLSNMLTTRSNTYAVWLTVGFFEVGSEDPGRLSALGITNAPPELGAEVNADIGQNVRHRAFFIIDRSKARGYLGPPRSSDELQDNLSQVVVHSRIIE